MAVSGAQKTRIGGYFAAPGKVEVFLAKEEADVVVVPADPHGSMSQGWSLPHYEKPEEKQKLVVVEPTPVIEAPAVTAKDPPKLRIVERDKTLDEDQAKLLAAEIKALELAIEQDKLLAERQGLELEEALLAAKLLKEQQEAEELMVMLLLAAV